MKFIHLYRAAAIGSLLLGSAVGHAQSYTFQKLNISSTLTPRALELTDSGQVGGWATDFIHLYGFTDSSNVYTQVSIPGYSTTQITAIGGSTLYGIVNETFGFARNAQGVVTLLRGSGFEALPNGVNRKNVVVGQTQVAGTNKGAFVLQNGTYKTFLYPGSDVTTFNAINDDGVIVGTYNKNGGPLESFELKSGQTTSVAFPGAYSTVVTGINDSGEMIGYYIPVPQAGFKIFRYSGGVYSNIASPANSYACFPWHLNNLGDFVGNCADNATKQQYSFVATPAENTEVVLPPQ